jgi:hypothetical protein
MESKLLKNFWKRFCIFRGKTDFSRILQSQNSFLELKYAYIIALTLGVYWPALKGLKLAVRWLQADCRC